MKIIQANQSAKSLTGSKNIIKLLKEIKGFPFFSFAVLAPEVRFHLLRSSNSVIK